MARPLRIQVAGGLYHLTSRGNRRGPIYLDRSDRNRFLDLFHVICARRKWSCFSYCLMTTHYHLVVRTPEADLSAGMQYLNGVFAQSFNRKYEEVGHVFQGRYYSELVTTQSHLLDLVRYLALNPVRAGAVRDPADWPWSSYAAAIGKAPRPGFLAVDEVLRLFSRDPRIARRRLRDFVESADTDARPAA